MPQQKSDVMAGQRGFWVFLLGLSREMGRTRDRMLVKRQSIACIETNASLQGILYFHLNGYMIRPDFTDGMKRLVH
ncbi:hypothetical protein EYF80_007511 [Liparis tanakae]|uniref:Uncharacterized protein n=1 Tax=Liparis tanakae TaxID=230148 RepID=A0A4Z2IY19_9TELE|nr:hypothetical protein EYF80_007511 [Liparis tanakae]